jgi:phage terminase small subunit
MADINAQQQQFINEYLTLGNATKAAIAVGYSAKTAQAQGSRLLKQPSIKLAIQAQQQQASIETQTTLQELLIELEAVRVAALARGQCSAAVSATMGKARLLGLDKPKDRENQPVDEVNRIIIEFVDGDQRIEKDCLII